MGNNYCKALGIVPGHPIHLSQFDQLWRQFDTKNRGYLSKSDASNFLKVNGLFLQVPWQATFSFF